MSPEQRATLLRSIRTIPDYPRPGIQFRDITTLLGDAAAFRIAVDALAEPWRAARVTHVAGIEARGFILGGAVAHVLGAAFVPMRKKGKLPHVTVSIAYSLEYGVDHLEMHRDAVSHRDRVLLIDDLIATGGTATAAVNLLRGQGADVVGAGFVIDLPALTGAIKVAALDLRVESLLAFDGH
jgi:adenine phosphoribosyltransferase